LNKKVSIIVPVFNGAKYIDRFVECLSGQTYKNIEIIFIDDGSTDNTFDICKSYERRNERIKIFSKDNGGPSSARNIGIEKAIGDYVVFFDIDDEFEDNILEDNLKIALESDADIVIWNFKMQVIDENKTVIRKLGSSFSGSSEEFFDKYLIPVIDNEMFNPPWNKMVRRNFLIANNICFNTRYSLYEDILFSCNVFRYAKRVAVNDEIYYTYLIKSSGSLLTKLHKECFKAVTEIYNTSQIYCGMYDDNIKQKERFEKQYVYLAKGYLKRICVDEQTNSTEKAALLDEVRLNKNFNSLLKKHSRSIKNKLFYVLFTNRQYKILSAMYR